MGSFYEHPALYDALLPPSEVQLDFYARLARKHRGEVLGLACGSGQIVVPIAAAGVPMTGLDRSKAMLIAARDRAASIGARIELVQGDMTTLDLTKRFSLIFVARNSLLHLSDPHEFTAFFSSVRRHLAPGGVLAFDIFNPDVALLARPSGERFLVMSKVVAQYGNITVEATNDYDAQSQVNRATWFVSTTNKQDAWVFPLHLRSIFPQELPALLAANGFDLLRRDGDFSGGQFASASRSQVCLCLPA